jgi:hypothetical protein
MRDELATVLRLVAEGALSPEEAAPIIEALSASGEPGRARSSADERGGGESASSPASRLHLRVSISERGRQVINLRIPARYADAALRMVPGIAATRVGDVRSAIAAGTMGPILDVEDEDGSRVLITIE